MQNQLDDGWLYMNYRGYYGVSGFSNSEIVVVPESGHACHLDNPDFTLETIKTFLEEVLPR